MEEVGLRFSKKKKKNIVEKEENAGRPAFSSFSTMFSNPSKANFSHITKIAFVVYTYTFQLNSFKLLP